MSTVTVDKHDLELLAELQRDAKQTNKIGRASLGKECRL